ncbi:MAG TPA: 2-dehydropantoate 2-reductase [Thermoanaerobaculia bacterium]|nr:2-dehydropantoate 2-reductase [Thermoanaerobaculia bacterium]
MRFAIVGAGGVGGYFGGRLAQSGADVTFITRGATREALRTNGLRVDSIAGDFHLPRVNVDPTGTFDAVLLCVKAWQIADAARSILPFLHDTTAVVPLENGIDAPETLIPIVGESRTLGGLCAIISFVVAPGHIKHAGAEPLVALGELDHRVSARAAAIRDAFVAASVKCEIPPDIRRSMWTKFLFIAPVSGIGAVTRVPIGAWRTTSESRDLCERMLREIIALANARGITLAEDAIAATLKRIDNLPYHSTASLQRDVIDGKPSELDAQLGAIVRMARESNVATPVTEVVYHALLPQERRARLELGERT